MFRIMLKRNQIHLLISILCTICIISCKTDTPTQTNNTPAQNNEAMIVAALQTVQDSMQLSEDALERISDIMIRYENETKEVQQQQFNNPKSKQQVMQNLLKSRRTELGDVLKSREMMSFNKLYKQSLANERKRAREEKQLSEEDRKALSEKLNKYRKESVIPVVVEQRKALEATMNPANKKQISELREKIKTFNQSYKDKKDACAAIDQKDRRAKMACRRQLRNLHKNYEPIKKESGQLIKLLEESPDTQTIMADMEARRDIWRTNLKNMLETYSENEIEVDKVPLGKYFPAVPAHAFLLFNTENIDESILETVDNE